MCNIFLDAPKVGEKEKEYLCRAIDSGFVSTIGPFVAEFETKFANYLGLEKAVSAQSGTAALHISLIELGLKPGDEVIVPDLTFIATINPILYLGAKPVIVDIDVNTWNISPQQIRDAITPRTRAIIPVHLYGNPCNMDEIMQIAQEHNLYVIEDATESLGAKYKGRFTGTIGDFGAFSFNGNKTMTTGGGGMIVGKNVDKLSHIKFLVNQARDEAKGYYHPEVGYNYRMTNIEASLGLAQLEQFEAFLAQKRKFRIIYESELTGRVGFQQFTEGSESSCWFTAINVPNVADVSEIQAKLKDKGLPSRRNFAPLHTMPPYKEFAPFSYANTDEIYRTGLCLPCSCLNSDEAIYSFCTALKELL